MKTEGATRASTTAQSGVRPLDALTEADLDMLGDEVADLATLAAAGVPIAPGFVVSFDESPALVARRLSDALASPPPDPPLLGSVPPPPLGRPVLKLRPWFRTMSLAQRAEGLWPALADATTAEDVGERVAAAFDGVRAPAMAAALARSPGALWMRALICDEGSFGRASSVDPDDGDPDSVAVWLPERSAWRIDRKTMRTVEEGGGPLARSVLERAADLADRAQLALGRPVELDWVLSRGKPVVARVRPMAPVWRFTDESWRVVELLWHDEGPIAPLAVDALDKALREDDDPLDVLRVRRVFARAYRWVEAGRGRQGGRRESFTTAAARAGQVALDVARPITQARDFGKTLHERLASFDSDDLARMEDGQLLRALRERQGVVIEAYELLDRGRKATSTVLGALEAALGTVPRECVHGLAAIRRTRARRRLDERLAKAAGQLGALPDDLSTLPPKSRKVFDELRRQLAGRRPLGLDVRPLDYGSSDAALVEGMRAAVDGRSERAEREQRQAIRRLMATARSRPLGRGRAALARTLTLMIERLADAKGQVAEGLAEASLRQRAVAIEVGRRLVDHGILDEPEDVLFLYVPEVQDALVGEPGAYAARVRLRREADARWRHFGPPTRLVARARPRRPTWEA